MNSLTFSGHETFACRHYWLKKGFDFVANKKKFSAEDAVVELGVGNNMVRSIRHWLKAFDLADKNDKLTELAKRIFSDEGWDPFLEDEGTLWLLHYKLNEKKYAPIYNIIFNELRKQKPEFTRKHFFNLIEKEKGYYNGRTLRDAFSVFSRTYLNDKSKDIEDSYSGLLAELNLLREFRKTGNTIYNIENRERNEIPTHIILYAILENQQYGNSIPFDSLYSDENGIGNIFALNKEGLVYHLEKIAKLYPKKIVFNNDPLVKELQFKGKKTESLAVLNDYYRQGA